MASSIAEGFELTFSGIRPGEFETVSDLIRSCGLHTDDLTVEMCRDFIVARSEGTIVGVVGLERKGSHALLRSLAVTESFRGAGVGSRLLKAVERYAFSQGVSRLHLLTLTAKRFFTRHGFGIAERGSQPASIRNTAEFRTLCPETAVCMTKDVAPSPRS